MTDTDAHTAGPVVEVYWRPGCPHCRHLLRPLRRANVRLREINIWENPAAAARVRSVAHGNETVPTVFVGDWAMVNPSVWHVLATAGVVQEPPGPWWNRWKRADRAAHRGGQ